MLSFGSFVSSTAILAYLIDTHGTNALHVITPTDFAKYMVSYGMAFVANGIVLSAGVELSLLVVGASLGTRRPRWTCTGSLCGPSSRAIPASPGSAETSR
ncbi:hypothetical protein V8D89_012210 [Ganoderma adspersum]